MSLTEDRSLIESTESVELDNLNRHQSLDHTHPPPPNLSADHSTGDAIEIDDGPYENDAATSLNDTMEEQKHEGGEDPQAEDVKSDYVKDDDFKVGDRVLVGGNKPGVIAFIGKTNVASGTWAGIELDNKDGKNDGSLYGVRYFQTEPYRGVFVKLNKLSRVEDEKAIVGTEKSKSSQPSTPRFNKIPIKENSSRVKLGDRVVVKMASGCKEGILRYVGTPHFANGEWAGVELFEANGKNDGSVAGKRYFQCKNMHGVFTSIYKVTSLTGVPLITTTISQNSRCTNSSQNMDHSESTPRSTEISKMSSASPDSNKKSSPSLQPTRERSRSRSSPIRPVCKAKIITREQSDSELQIGSPRARSGRMSKVLSREQSDSQLLPSSPGPRNNRAINCRGMARDRSNSQPRTEAKAGDAQRERSGSGTRSRNNSCRERTSSQDSIRSKSTNVSATSSVKAKCVQAPIRPSSISINATKSALQQALKEKESYIEQLLRERELERTAVAKAAIQVDKTESELSVLRAEYERYIFVAENTHASFHNEISHMLSEKREILDSLQQEIINMFGGEKSELLALLDEGKRRVQNMEFVVKEASNKFQINPSTEKENIDEELEKEKKKMIDLETQIAALKKETENRTKCQNEDLMEKIKDLESRLKVAEEASNRYEAEANEYMIELDGKNHKMIQMICDTDEAKKIVDELKASLDEAMQDRTKLEAERNEMKKSLDKQAHLKMGIEKANSELKAKLNELKQSLDKQTNINIESEKANNQLKVELQELKDKGEKETLTEKTDSLLKDKLHEMKTSLKKQTELYAETEKINKELTLELQELKEKAAKEKESDQELQLMVDIEEALSKNKQLKDELHQTRGKLNDSNKELENANKILSAERKKADEASKNVENVMQENDDLKSKLENTSKEVSDLKAELAQAKKIVEEHNLMMSDLQESKKVMDKYRELKCELKEAKEKARKCNKLEEMLTEANKKIINLQGEVEGSINYQSELQLELDDARAMLADNDRLRRQLEKAKKLAAMQSEFKKKLHEVREVATENIDLKEQLHKAKERENELEEKLQELQQIDTDHKLQVALAESADLVLENTNLKAQLKEQQEADDKINKLKEEFEEAKKEAREYKQLEKKLSEKISELTDANAQLKNDLQETMHVSAKQNILLMDYDQVKKETLRCKQLSKELEEMKKIAQNHHEEAEFAQAEHAVVKEECSNLKAELAKLKTKGGRVMKESLESHHHPGGEQPASNNESVLLQLKREKEAAESHIMRLNAMMFEMQCKNEELELRLHVSDARTNSSMSLGARDSIGSLPRQQAVPAREMKPIAACPSVFCDICEALDEHSTEDCPQQGIWHQQRYQQYQQQAMYAAGGKDWHHKVSSPPYCFTCNEMGHMTEECEMELIY